MNVCLISHRFYRRCVARWCLLPLVVLFLWDASPGRAARPKFWRQHTYEEFAGGETKGISITGDGTLRLAPALVDSIDLETQRIWSLAVGPDGIFYAGTGDDGKLFEVNGKGQIRLLFDSPEIAIHALTVDAEGVLYAGTAPDGLIYKIEPDGQISTLAHSGSHYIWDLTFDAEGQLYAATGEPGKVLSVSAKGEVETLYDPPDRHVMALLAADGRLYAGTAQEARIYEISDDATRLLHAAEQQEIHDLVVGADGALYASAISRPNDKENSETESAIYRIAADGAVTSIWEESETLLIDLIADQEDGLLTAAAEPARLYRISQKERGSILLRFEALQPSCLLRAASGALYIGASQSGEIRRLSLGHRSQGHFDAAAEDFGGHARWGVLNWRAEKPKGTRLRFRTRSGNSEEPDDTWSSWSAELDESGSPIASPPARYLQYRAELETSTPERTPILHAVEISGRQTNLRPEIDKLEVIPYRSRQRGGNGAQDQSAAAAPQTTNSRRRPPHAKSLYMVRWQASDRNGDELSYRLYLRGVDHQEWKLVEESLSQNSILWDTETMPEGMTLLKLVASDNPDNPEDEALETERLSPPFPIDNSPPRVELQVRGKGELTVEVEIHDTVSPVHKAQYSVDYSDQVHQIQPLDGLFDSREEKARFVVEGLPPGEHIIAVQVWDALENIGTRQAVVQVK